MPDYRFSRADFGALPLAPLHYDLFFDVRATRVRVVSRQTYICNAEDGLSRLELKSIADLKVLMETGIITPQDKMRLRKLLFES